MIADGRIEVRASARRKKTVSIQESGHGWVLLTPQRWRPERHADQIAQLISRLESRRKRPAASDAGLLERALRLNDELFADGRAPTRVTWVDNQHSRFASTTPATGAIRVSRMLSQVPAWVLDAVLVHELAHLRVANHSPEFKALTQRYPKTADADLFLAGFSAGRDHALRSG